MYCVKCGVELPGGIQACPLCGTKVHSPEPEDIEPAPYPPFMPSAGKSRTGWMGIITAICMLPVILCFAIDIRINSGIQWSGYTAAGIAAFYMSVLFPFWFEKKNPVIFFPVAAASALLLLFYICAKTGGHWFLNFAFPVTGAAAAIAETVIVLLRYAGKGLPHRAAVIFGGGVIGLGALCVLVELLIHVSFGVDLLWWSFIPFTVQLAAGVLMIIVGANAHLRNSFYKKFFI